MSSSVLALISSEYKLNLCAEKVGRFVDLFNFVLDPPIKMSIIEPTSRTFADLLPVLDPAILVFRTVFRSHFRTNRYLDMAAVYQEAYKKFVKAILQQVSCSNSHDWSTKEEQEALKRQETYLNFQLQTETEWIAAINERLRHKFKTTAMQDATVMFRLLLDDRFPTGGLRHYHENDFINTTKGMVQVRIKAFAQEIPMFESETVIEEWCKELHQKLHQIILEGLITNKANQEQWKSKIDVAAEFYVELMKDVLEKYPYLRQYKVDQLHQEAKLRASSHLGFHRAIWNPLMKSTWNLKIDKEFWNVRSQRKSVGSSRISNFITGMKAAYSTISKQYFSVDDVEDGFRLGEHEIEPDLPIWWSTLDDGELQRVEAEIDAAALAQ